MSAGGYGTNYKIVGCVPQAHVNKIASYKTQISTTLCNNQKREQRAFDTIQRH